MDMFDMLTFFGGLALFLFGMSVMGESLEKSAGSRLKNILGQLTSSPLRGLLLGIGVTAVIQSSSATTVMVIGFVNSGLMSLGQVIPIIMGANIGTTVTSWLLSLVGLESANVFVRLLKPSSFAPVLAAIGIVLFLPSKSGRKKDAGAGLLGFGVLIAGMETMTSSVSGLANAPAFIQLFTFFQNPILGLLAGALLTGIIQSSSASVGILQALATTGNITYSCAIPIILGQNIGTCVTAMLSSVGACQNARRAAIVHLYFNTIGAAVFLGIFCLLRMIAPSPWVSQPVGLVGIAVIHSVFNISCTALMLPFAKGLEQLACLTIRDEHPRQDSFQLLDDRLLVTPPIAIQQCRLLMADMAQMTRKSLSTALAQVGSYHEDAAGTVRKIEEQADLYEDKLGSYLVKLAALSLSDEDSREVSRMLHSTSEFERITDHSVSILLSAGKIYQRQISFSPAACREFQTLSRSLVDVMARAASCFEDNDPEIAQSVEPLSQVVDFLCTGLRERHIRRLQQGSCSVEQGMIFTDLLSDCSRVSAHCSNVAACVIEIRRGSLDTHEYLDALKAGDPDFLAQYNAFMEQYSLPESEPGLDISSEAIL